MKSKNIKFGFSNLFVILVLTLLMFSTLVIAGPSSGRSGTGTGASGDGEVNQLSCRDSNSCSEIDNIWASLLSSPGFTSLNGKKDLVWYPYDGESTVGVWVEYNDKYEIQEDDISGGDVLLTLSSYAIDTNQLESLMQDLSDGKHQITAKGGRQYCSCKENCGNYATSIMKYSEEYSVDPLLVVSLMMKESSCKQSVGNSSAGCVGATQICKYEKYEGACTKRGPQITQLSDLEGESNYDDNIHCGISLLKEEYESGKRGYPDGRLFTCTDTLYQDWGLALRYYNGWVDGSYCEKQSNIDQFYYVEKNFEIYDQLVAIQTST